MRAVASLEDAAVEWLQSSEVVRADGAVMSWVNPDRPGYAYPEIAGYMLSFLAQEPADTTALRDRVAARLHADMSRRGGVGRAGIDYAFDSAMALSGLIAHERAGGRVPEPLFVDRLFDFVVECIQRRVALVGNADADPAHWSVSYGSHLLKTVLAITAYDRDRPTPIAQAVVAQLLADLLPLSESGRFRANELTRETYTHSHCYAIEGLLGLGPKAGPSVQSLIEGGADWLTRIQLPDGGVPSRHDGRSALGPPHTDCTAQSVRIWASVDRDRYAEAIDRGTAFLYGMEKDGGFRYRPDSNDVNTWATIFAVQALRWGREGVDSSWIV